MPETCEYHVQLVSDIAVIKNDLKYMRDKVCEHVTEGEKSGGWRDRLLVVEKEVAALRTSVWKIGITSGLIGALIGNATPEMVKLIVGFFR
jgi:hypothetical protein